MRGIFTLTMLLILSILCLETAEASLLTSVVCLLAACESKDSDSLLSCLLKLFKEVFCQFSQVARRILSIKIRDLTMKYATQKLGLTASPKAE
ncbi:unnamed protein product [Heterobilharzia americana]|nr:unnamed protein product [Heterobilharzia americana]CAH8600636.1 unnamed protein product [Heterobilharzia americana]